MKKVLAILLTLTLLAGLFGGCAKPPEPTTPINPGQTKPVEPEKPAEKVNLKYWAYARWKGVTGEEPNGEFGDWQKDVAKRYMDANQNVTIEFEHLPWNGGPEKVNVAIATGTPPNVLEDGMGRIFAYVAKGVIQSMDESMSAEELADMTQGTWDLVKYTDGKHYALPWANMVIFPLINMDLFKSAGALDLLPQNEEKTWSYAQFRKALEAVSKDGVYGTAIHAANEQGDSGTNAMIWGCGGDIFNEDRTKITYASPEGIKGLTFMNELVRDRLAMPGAESIKSTDAIDYFIQGKIAVLLNGTSGVVGSNMKTAFDQGTAKPFEVGWAMYPTEEGIAPRFQANPVTVCAFKSGNAAQEQAAVDFAKFATMGENAKAVKCTKLLPVYKSAGNLYEGDALMEWNMKVVKYAFDPGFSSPVYAQMRACLFPEMQAVYSGQKTPEQGMTDFAAKAQAEIDKAK